jgi:hypothetical protein
VNIGVSPADHRIRRITTVAHYHMGDKTMYENDQSYFARRL